MSRDAHRPYRWEKLYILVCERCTDTCTHAYIRTRILSRANSAKNRKVTRVRVVLTRVRVVLTRYLFSSNQILPF